MFYFTADLHLNHYNIIQHGFGAHERSQFRSIDEMNCLIINNWNNIVNMDDTVYILGDIALGDPARANEILSSLPGKKYY